jgi:histidine triad (HIT) family protein
VKILKGEIPSTEVYSDEHVYCFLDLYPQNPGHTLVIPRKYSPNMLEAKAEHIAYCMDAVRKLVPAIQQATGAKGATVQTNIGREAGQMIEYLHFHIIPRHGNDYISYYKLGDEQKPEQLAELAEKIKQHL